MISSTMRIQNSSRLPGAVIVNVDGVVTSARYLYPDSNCQLVRIFQRSRYLYLAYKAARELFSLPLESINS